jgi:DNA-binding response OmpR family regulator
VTAVAAFPHSANPKGVVLVVDDDAMIADLVTEVLTEEGYAVTILAHPNTEAIHATVTELQPDCVLLDSDVPGSFGVSWASAAWMAAQRHAVPVIMFSADTDATAEASSHASERSQAAHFSSVLPKPFDLDELLRAVALAVSQSPFRQRSTG